MSIFFKPKQEAVVKEFYNPSSSSNAGFTNALATEVAIFPPPGVSGLSGEPSINMPVIVNKQPPKPSFVESAPNPSDWFQDINHNYPRQLIFFQKEIGKGWFGKVVEGETRGTKVAVRILRENATLDEVSIFLNEVRPYRDLWHKNVMRLFGQCLDHEPYLLLFEMYNHADLKKFLMTNGSSKAAMFEQGICLKLMTDLCEGVQFMNSNGFILTDLAARNCLVTSDLTLKLGDFGASIDLYKNEYYHSEGVAIPIRWCAPETLLCTETSFEMKKVTAASNVWSLGITLWEITTFGKMPYDDLTDEEVINRVLGEEKYRLSMPDCPFGQYFYNIMQICWRTENRASVVQVLEMLYYLNSNPFQENDFESRWKKLKPNSVPVLDNHTPIHSPRHTQLAQGPKLLEKTEFDSGVDLEIKPSDENSYKACSPLTISPQLSVMSEEFFQSSQKKSPSLTNLKGSLEDVSQLDSWFQGIEEIPEERSGENTTENIKNLDDNFTVEKTSSFSGDSCLSTNKKLDFKLGPLSLERYDFSSDIEDEAWRYRIERGEFTEKVKEKSKSVTNLMVLTHIDSEESENDSLPSLTRQYSWKKNGNKVVTYTGIGFNSEGNIRNALLKEEMEEKLRPLSVWKSPDSSIVSTENFKKKSLAADTSMKRYGETVANSEKEPFLVKAASEIQSLNISSKTNVHKETVNSLVEHKDGSAEAAQIKEEGLSSQHELVPKIVVTESALIANDEKDEEPQCVIDFKPKRFYFVCHDSDESDSESSPSKGSSQTSNVAKEIEVQSSVILGSCEEYTLDYFKGLKTTFSPTDQYSDDENEIKDLCTKESLESVMINELFHPPNSAQNALKKSPFQPLNKPMNVKVSKSKSLDSGLCAKVDADLTKLTGLIEAPPPFNTCDCADDIFQNGSFDSYFSADSGHSSERCIDQDRQMNDLKTRLEDVMKYGDDFQLRNSEEEYGFKLLTPDDERSSDSGFRDKGSLSESVEDTCDEKYNLEDIDAELDDYTLKTDSYEQFINDDKNVCSIEGWFLHPKVDKSGWTPVSTEDEEKCVPTIDAEFVTAIRNELKEKLPCIQQNKEEEEEEESSPDSELVDSIRFTYPAQLSPILEEHESNQSSLLLDDRGSLLNLSFSLKSDNNEDIDNILNTKPISEPGLIKEIYSTSSNFPVEDFLVVDTETNEATLIESPNTHTQIHLNSLNSTESSLSSENRPLSPDISIGSNTLSSPENCNLSGIFMSPCSIRSDLFDSGPPSLPFDFGQSLEDVEEMSPCKVNENIHDAEVLHDESDSGSSTDQEEEIPCKSGDIINVNNILTHPVHEKAEFKIDQLLESPESAHVSPGDINVENKNEQNDWLKGIFAKCDDEFSMRDWPSNDELISPVAEELKQIKLRPNLNSTLALLSPDPNGESDDSKFLVDGKSVVVVPMPSPEDAEKGWRPTMSQLMELTDHADGEEMTTSFIEPDDNGTYTPEWESDASESSSSGEFIWKEGDKDESLIASDSVCLLQEPSKMERIDEEQEDEEDDKSDSFDDSLSEGSGAWVPSTWNPTAVPKKSALKSSTTEKKDKKRVLFKKEKYECVYQYPKEFSDDEDKPLDPWNSSFFISSPMDYSNYTDWELGEMESANANDLDSDGEDPNKKEKAKEYDFYRLNYNMGPHLITEDGEFYISSSSQAFDWSDSEKSEFFPGQCENSENINFMPSVAQITPLNLGELRHTKETLRLELPTPINQTCINESQDLNESPNDKSLN